MICWHLERLEVIPDSTFPSSFAAIHEEQGLLQWFSEEGCETTENDTYYLFSVHPKRLLQRIFQWNYHSLEHLTFFSVDYLKHTIVYIKLYTKIKSSHIQAVFLSLPGVVYKLMRHYGCYGRPSGLHRGIIT